MMTASTRVCSTDFKESRICSALSDVGLRIGLLQRLDHGLRFPGKLHSRRVLLLRDGNGDGGVPVVAGHGIRRLLVHVDIRHVLQVHGASVLCGEGDVLQPLQRVVLHAGGHGQLLVPDIGLAGRIRQAGSRDILGDGLHREAVLHHLFFNELDLDVFVGAAPHRDLGRVRHLLKLRDDLIIHIGVKIRPGRIVDGQGDVRLGVHAHLHDGRFAAVVRETVGDAADPLFQIVVGIVRVGTVFKLDLDHGTSFGGGGADGLDAGERTDPVLDHPGHQFIHILRTGAGIGR